MGDLQIQLSDIPGLNPSFMDIAAKLDAGERLTGQEGILLFEEGTLSELGIWLTISGKKDMDIEHTSTEIFT